MHHPFASIGKVSIPIVVILVFSTVCIAAVDAHNIASAKEPAATNVIVVTGTGFSPEKITITKGNTVAWINEGNALPDLRFLEVNHVKKWVVF